MITLQWAYWLFGGLLAWIAWRSARDRSNPRRGWNAAFWGLLAPLFLFGERLPPVIVGVGVVAVALIAGSGRMGAGKDEGRSVEQRRGSAARLGHRLLLPALLIPAMTLALVLSAPWLRQLGWPLLHEVQATVIALALACLVATGVACVMLREPAGTAVDQGRRLLDAIGWAALLPLLLATLGSVFAAAGVGEAVAGLVRAAIPVDSRIAVVLAYALGMALFTMIMGNAFAAFPVMTAGVGLPLLVQLHGADAAPLAAIGMLAGYCGTLLTPMAANFNLVPVALLELDDPYAVIRAQIGTALPLLGCNIVLMYLLVFR